MTPRTLAWAAVAATVLLLGVGNVVVWGPLWRHYHVSVPEIDSAVLQRHRQEPADGVLAVVAEVSMMTDHPLRGDAAVAVARRILQGELALPFMPVLAIGDGFSPAQLEAGVPVQQVWIASLIVPDLLLRAHEHAPDPAYLAAAERYLRGYIAHEARVQFPEGLLANSHSVSNRAAVLARFWRQVRTTASDELARTLQTFARRTGTLLARPGFFIARTNHGVMQNVGLLQLAAAFPAMPEAASWRDTALQRLERQRPMYIGPDGAVLEHALGYHFHGVVVSGYILRLMHEMGQPVPEAWAKAHEGARAFMATLQRPDRSLPAIGNTFRYAWRLPALVQPDDEAWVAGLRGRASFSKSFPLSGHAVWWDADAAGDDGVQTVMNWGWWAQHGHTSAQEMSLHIWSAGTDWSTNTGYWPGGDGAGAVLAAGWDGGNGPHLIGEKDVSERRTWVRGQAEQGGLRVLDLERVVANGPRFRRQVIQWQARQWVVLDSVQGAPDGTLRVLWTSAPSTTQAAVGDGSFTLQRAGVPQRFSVAVDGGAGVSATPLSGSRNPFGGWVAVDRKAVPAPAVDARLPVSGGWMMTTLQLAATTEPPLRALMQRHTSAEDWVVQLPLPGEPVTLTRQGRTLTVTDGQRSAVSVDLAPGPAVDAERAAIEAAGASVRREFPRFRTAEAERREQSILLVGAWLIAMAGLWFIARRRRTATAEGL